VCLRSVSCALEPKDLGLAGIRGPTTAPRMQPKLVRQTCSFRLPQSKKAARHGRSVRPVAQARRRACVPRCHPASALRSKPVRRHQDRTPAPRYVHAPGPKADPPPTRQYRKQEQWPRGGQAHLETTWRSWGSAPPRHQQPPEPGCGEGDAATASSAQASAQCFRLQCLAQSWRLNQTSPISRTP